MAEMRRWTDQTGTTWECDAYDHGPMCRQCRRVADHDGHTINLGSEAVDIETDAMKRHGDENELDRLRAENAEIRAVNKALKQCLADDQVLPRLQAENALLRGEVDSLRSALTRVKVLIEDAVRDLFTPEALAQAAAKIVTGGEEGSGVVPHGSAAPCTDPSGDTAAAKVQEADR